MKFKIGDKVRVKKDLEAGENYGGLTLWEGQMSDQRGKEVIITSVVGAHYGVDGGFFLSEPMLEPVEEKKVRRPTKFVKGDVVQIKGMDTHLKVDDIDLWGGCSKPDYHLIDRNGAYHGWFDEDDLVLYHPEESYLNYEKSEEFEEAMSHVEEIEKRRVVEDLVYKLADKLIDYLMEV